jgi:hypothetical protein
VTFLQPPAAGAVSTIPISTSSADVLRDMKVCTEAAQPELDPHAHYALQDARNSCTSSSSAMRFPQVLLAPLFYAVVSHPKFLTRALFLWIRRQRRTDQLVVLQALTLAFYINRCDHVSSMVLN